MLLLSLTSLRAAAVHPDLSQATLQGDCVQALRLGTERFERLGSATGGAAQRAVLGQLIGRLMLACGREAEAEDLFQRQLKVYEGVSRQMVRWHGALDQAALMLHLNRSARALECFNVVVDDREAPDEVRVEAIAGAAVSLMRSSGDCRGAMQLLDAARRLSDGIEDARFGFVIEGLALELSALRRERTSDALDDHGLWQSYLAGDAPADDVLLQQLEAAARYLDKQVPLAGARLRCLAELLGNHNKPAAVVACLQEHLCWLRDRSMNGLEMQARVEAGLVLIGRGAPNAAAELLASLIFDEQQVNRSRYSMELQYCLAKLHVKQGRYMDALRLYRNHMQQVVQSLKNIAAPRTSRLLATTQEATQADRTKMRLPLRYRKAYQYIVDHLQDENLSVRQIAAHIGVTERALQLAFRAHLGLTPAELIRMRRMEGIRGELCEQPGNEGVLEVASRWGIKNRSTLVHNYRRQFEETPTQTLRGGNSANGVPATNEAA